MPGNSYRSGGYENPMRFYMPLLEFSLRSRIQFPYNTRHWSLGPRRR